MTFLTTLSLGSIHRDRFEYETGSSAFSFKNGKFYTYNVVIAYYEAYILYINPISRKFGGCYYSHTTSKHLSKLVSLCEKFDMDYEMVKSEDYIEEKK